MGNSAGNKIRGYSLAAIAIAAFGFIPFSAGALKNDDDTLVEGAKLCTRYLPRHERQYGIPEHLLAAIASTESGRFHRALGLNLPWPWTINVEGTGYFFDSKEEAIEAVRSFQARGVASIDVGCMQVNLMHHPTAFATLDQAFDPAYNVAYGAQFLRRNFEEEGSWHKATADYHSRTNSYGEPYARLVYSAWSRIINKVADARSGRPILSAAAARPSYASAKAHSRSMHMHSISVARDTTREDGVIVVRPEFVSQEATLQASNNDDLVTNTRRPIPERDKIERTAVTPNGINGEGAFAQDYSDNGDHGAKIIHVQADATVTPKGQFEPAVVVNAGDSSSPAVTIAPAASSTATPTPKSPFVFNY